MSKKLKLFPLRGFEFEKTSFVDVYKKYGKDKFNTGVTNYRISGHDIGVVVDGLHFILSGKLGNQIFTRLYLQDDSAFPKEWEAFGMKWDMSWDEWIAYLEKKNGNHHIEQHYPDLSYMTGILSSIIKLGSSKFCKIRINFHGPNGSNNTTKNTVQSIDIISNIHGNEHKDRGYAAVYKGKAIATAEDN